jgi:hypothetical protein
VRFFLWGYPKAQVCQHLPQTLEALKEAITQEVAAILSKMTRRVMENYWERLDQCIDNEGRHVSDIIIENALCILFMIKNFFFCILLGLDFIIFHNWGVLPAAPCRKITDLILDNRRLTAREIADEVGISTGSAHSIVTVDLLMCRVMAKFVLNLLAQEQQQLALRLRSTCWSAPTGILSS